MLTNNLLVSSSEPEVVRSPPKKKAKTKQAPRATEVKPSAQGRRGLIGKLENIMLMPVDVFAEVRASNRHAPARSDCHGMRLGTPTFVLNSHCRYRSLYCFIHWTCCIFLALVKPFEQFS